MSETIKYFGKHKQWWHEFMCIDTEMEWYIHKGKYEIPFQR